MAKFTLTMTSINGEKLPSFEYSNRTKKEVLEMINNAIFTHTHIGFFERMDLRDWLYSTSVMRGKAQRVRDCIKFTLVCEFTHNNEVVDCNAKEHAPYYIPRTQEEIREEYFERRESGMLPR